MQDNLKKLLNILDKKVSVVDIISDYISLEKKGNNFVGLCPFHSDSNPSMSVSPSKGIYKCFVCGAGGGSINFVQNYEGISFIDAIKKISDKTKVDWRDYLNSYEKKINPIDKRGWEINNEAKNFFIYNLKNSKNNSLKEYLKERDINIKIIDKFMIGFSGESNPLVNFLISKGFSEEEIIKYGLGKRNKKLIIYDYFINRLMFPIFDFDNNIIGFSGRIIDNSQYAKYLNSPETLIFKKNEILYNLNNAKISANLKKDLIIVEGFMDVIALFKLGIENVAASMGTSFTKQHINKVKAISKNVTLAFDSDTPGINATILAGKELIKNKINTYVAEIPFGKDFDELNKKNENLIKEVLDNKIDFLLFYKKKIFYLMEGASSSKFSNLLKILLETILIFNDKIIYEQIFNEVSKKFQIDKEIIKDEFKKINSLEVTIDSKNINNNNNNNNLKKELNNSLLGFKNSKFLTHLLEDEELILYYGIINDKAFNYIDSILMPWYRDNFYDAWCSWKFYKKDNVKILNEKSLKIINYLKNSDLNQKIEKEQISNIKLFKEFINRYIQNYKLFQKQKLKEEINNSSDENEKKHLIYLLSKFND